MTSRRRLIAATLLYAVCAPARATVVAPYFEGEVGEAARIGLVEVVRVEPFAVLNEGRKIDCGRLVDVRALQAAKGGSEPYRFSMPLGSERLEPGAQGLVFAFPVAIQDPTGEDRQILARIGALDRLLCLQAGGPLGVSSWDQSFWRLDRDSQERFGEVCIEVSEDSFLWSAKEASVRILDEATSRAARKRHVFSVEAILQRVRSEM